MDDDGSLLRDFAASGSQQAFSALVARHSPLVYNSALRRLGGRTDHAADVAQKVFVQLARHAGRLSEATVLAAWLHTATRHAALNVVISERRRKEREGEVARQQAWSSEDAAVSWDEVSPMLDEAIDDLSEADRSVVVLRFLEQRAYREIAQVLRVSEDAARMRLDRALGKLRSALARRGVISTSAALAGVVSAHSGVAVPAELLASLSSNSLASATAGTALIAITSLMKIKIVLALAAVAALSFFMGSYSSAARRSNVMPPVESAKNTDANPMMALHRENERLEEQLAQARSDLASVAAHRSAEPMAQDVAVQPLSIGMTKGEIQQGILNNLRQLSAARDQFKIDKGGTPSAVDDIVGRKKYIKQLRTVNGESYAAIDLGSTAPITVKTPDGIEVTYDPSGEKTTRPEYPPEVVEFQAAARLVAPSHQKAVEQYRAAHGGGLPPDDKALLPFFATPEAGADYVEFLEMKRKGGF